MGERPVWWAQAACHGQPLHIFFPPEGGSSEPAKQICNTCPVIHDCDQWATAQPAWLVGVFAAKNEHDRNKQALKFPK